MDFVVYVEARNGHGQGWPAVEEVLSTWPNEAQARAAAAAVAPQWILSKGGGTLYGDGKGDRFGRFATRAGGYEVLRIAEAARLAALNEKTCAH